MKRKPLVTVITPIYNLIKSGRKDCFIQNLMSVQNQTYKNVEQIIIDGASIDGTLNVLEEYKQKGWIKYYSEPDKGIYDAMNKGLYLANGKYIVFLNSDDYFCDENAISMSIETLLNENSDIIASNHNIIKENDKILMDNVKIGWEQMPFGRFPCHQTVFYKTALFKNFGGYNTDYIDADNISFCTFKKNQAKFSYNDVPIVNYRAGGASSTLDRNIAKEQFINYYYSDIVKNPKLTKEDYDYIYACQFKYLPLEQAINLGTRLAYSNPESIELYFQQLIEHIKIDYTNNPRYADIIKFLTSQIFSIKNKYSENEKRKIITVLGTKIAIKS